jgi:hypothetical protein
VDAIHTGRQLHNLRICTKVRSRLMKRLLIAIGLLLLLVQPVHAFTPAVQGMVGASKGAGACITSRPAGDIYAEGFEGSGFELGACGSGQCWSVSGTNDPDTAITSAAAQNCNEGLKITSTGTVAYASFHLTTAVPEYWREFSFYINSSGLNNGEIVPIVCSSTDSACTANINGQVKIKNTIGQLQIYGSAVGASTARNISAETWYFVRMHVIDIGNCVGADNPYVGCSGSGTGNDSITIGTTYGGVDIANGDTFAGANTASLDEFGLGAFLGSRTITVTFGYDAVDDDGTF